MKASRFEIIENSPLTKDVYLMRLSGDTGDITAPGQFVNIKIDGLYLRRPISVCDINGDELTIVYKVVGNGYDLNASGKKPVLLGGGVGVPPMYLLAKKLIAQGKDVSVVLGFNTKDELFFEDEFKALGAHTSVTTVDGSYGIKGFATDAMPENYTYFYTCGPEPMLKAVYKVTKTSGEFSFEQRMGCGFGACMGCSCKTITRYKRICKDGPVLRKEEILW